MGTSMGGGGAIRFALHFPDRFSAAASFAGFWNYHEYLAVNLHSLPLLIEHGDKDKNVPFNWDQAGISALIKLKYRFRVDKLRGNGHQYYKAWVCEEGPARLFNYFHQHGSPLS
jgi:dienelactone hydrolase